VGDCDFTTKVVLTEPLQITRSTTVLKHNKPKTWAAKAPADLVESVTMCTYLVGGLHRLERVKLAVQNGDDRPDI
jgi:hypothetical protein